MKTLQRFSSFFAGAVLLASASSVLATGGPSSYILTVNYGTNGGSYTNGAKVIITANAAPAGQVFDRWTGATQYVASVTSTPTTVTMPGSSITLTATYTFIGDDFNDNAVNTNKWGANIIMDESSTFLTETNAHLEFTGSVVSNATILRPWIVGMGSYTQNWEAAVDVNLGAITVPNDAGVQMLLAVANPGDPTLGDHLTVVIELDNDGYKTSRAYIMGAAVNETNLTAAPNCGEVATANTNGRMRIAFDASTKVLTASYNGNPLGWLDVDDAATSWDMTAGSVFMVVLGGSMWSDGSNSYTNGSHEVYADNFIFRYGNNLSYDLVINKGGGSGAYTNGRIVAITASNAPSGMAFDHWAGSTGYAANVTSSTTTVTMPAQAITLTATYKLIGEAVGDDFNDNVMDTAKWGNDVYIMSTNANLLETDERLEFRKEADTQGNNAYRPWIYSVGSYTQNWEISADAHLGNVTLPMDGEWVSMGLTVVNRQDTNLISGVPAGDALRVSLVRYGTLFRGYEMLSWVDLNELPGVPNYGYVETSDSDGRVKIAFDASTKVLTASYNGNVLGWLDVDASGSNWGMNDGSTFGIAIIGSAGSFAVSVPAGEVYADNFEVIGAVAPPEDGDGNGLPDWWELQHLGTPGNSNPNAFCSNGVNTLMEAYIAGLDPNNTQSRFGITGGDARNRMIQWNAVSGRVYNVYWTTNLLNDFQPLQTNYTGGSITDSLHGAEGKCFYRIDVRLAQ